MGPTPSTITEVERPDLPTDGPSYGTQIPKAIPKKRAKQKKELASLLVRYLCSVKDTKEKDLPRGMTFKIQNF